MKKSLCLLILGILLLSAVPSAPAEEKGPGSVSIREGLGALRDEILSFLSGKEASAAEKQLKEWQRGGAHVAKVALYVRRTADSILSLADMRQEDALVTDYLNLLSSEDVLLAACGRLDDPALSPDALRGSLLFDRPEGTSIIHIYAASYRSGKEAIALAQAVSDAFCRDVCPQMGLEPPTVFEVPYLTP